MSGLTKVPLSMLDPGDNAQANDEVVFNGDEVEAQNPGSADDTDLFITRGAFDPETGILNLYRVDDAIVQVAGFMTPHNIGVGPRGVTGPSGGKGDSGRNGKDGRPGLPGCTGPKGDLGPSGREGPSGPTGPRGVDGPVGGTGPAGATGPSGVDGERPSLTSGSVASAESILTTGRIMQWGRHTDADAEEFQEVIFPEAFASAVKPKALIMQWVNPSSNIANKVRVAELQQGKAVLAVNTSLLAQEPDGGGGTQPVPMTGWDFFWFVVGE